MEIDGNVKDDDHPENESDPLGSGRITQNSKIEGERKDQVQRSCQKRTKYHIKQGLSPEENRQKAYEPIEKESKPDKKPKKSDARVVVTLCSLIKASLAERLPGLLRVKCLKLSR